MRTGERDRYLLLGFVAVVGAIYLGIIGLAFSLGVGWRVFQWAAGF
jgi:hypothetical protein